MSSKSRALIEDVFHNDHVLGKYFVHVAHLGGDQIQETLKMILNTLRYREQNDIRLLKDEDMDKGLKKAGILYTTKDARDCDGKRLLTLNIKAHVKNSAKMDEMKKYFMYWTERLDREENGERITLVFDCEVEGDPDLVCFVTSFFTNNPKSSHKI